MAVNGKPEALARDYKDIREDYRYRGCDIMAPATKAEKVTYIIEKKLGQVDRTLILLYADCHSYRLLGHRLGLSHTVIAHEIKRIKAAIMTEYEKIKNNELLP